MRSAGCVKCHSNGKQADEQVVQFENDWINLERPELSRILRAPLAKDSEGFGLGLCQDRHPDPQQRRIRLLWDGYAHAVKPISQFARRPISPQVAAEGAPVVSFRFHIVMHTMEKCWRSS